MPSETTKKESPVRKATHTPRAAAHADAAKPVAAKAVRYIEAVGRRKTAIARVRITPGTGKVSINEMDATKYFTLPRLVAAAIAPLVDLKLKGDFDMSAKVQGGGIHAQAEAVAVSASPARSFSKIPNGKSACLPVAT